jgi:hypothetical protein
MAVLNAVRPLTSQKKQAELGALSLHQGPLMPGQLDPLTQRLANEKTMFATRHHALGGSQTTHNANDDAAVSVAPEFVGAVGNLISGNFHGAVKNVVSAGKNFYSGNTATVRKNISDILLQGGDNFSPAKLTKMTDDIQHRLHFIQNLVANSGSGIGAGIGVGSANYNTKRR